ncbi:leucine-rich repeat flightless-interacting protein 1 isoform X3 [Salmo trutta]|uniref:Leucine-rich repeat flightless-interacting protein 2-like n=1 Tax=Salmo trutta TaxID=8032 RepID=A0A673Y5M7_SALTR|nr:leucine-rich repeat flightless-interacting protein 1-like isoform X3 [Salmo trutta]
MGTQGTGRKRNPNKDRSTAEDDTLNLIAREAEARLALKRAARAEAREIRMKELERQQEEISDDDEQMSVGSRGSVRVEDRDFLEKGSQSASTRTAATLASLSGSSSRRGSGESPITGDTETSILEIKDIHDLKDQIQDVESKYMQSLKEVKDSLVEVEEKYRKAMVSNAQLDNEKNNLMYQVDRLKDSLMELEELLSESRREYDGMTKDFEREKHAYGVLQFQFNVMKETLKQSEELLTKHGIVLGTDLTTNGEKVEVVTERPASQLAQVSQISPKEGGNIMLGRAQDMELGSRGDKMVDPGMSRQQVETHEAVQENHLTSPTSCSLAGVSETETSMEARPCSPKLGDEVELECSNDNKDSDNGIPVVEVKHGPVCDSEVIVVVTVPEEELTEEGEGYKPAGIEGTMQGRVEATNKWEMGIKNDKADDMETKVTKSSDHTKEPTSEYGALAEQDNIALRKEVVKSIDSCPQLRETIEDTIQNGTQISPGTDHDTSKSAIKSECKPQPKLQKTDTQPQAQGGKKKKKKGKKGERQGDENQEDYKKSTTEKGVVSMKNSTQIPKSTNLDTTKSPVESKPELQKTKKAEVLPEATDMQPQARGGKKKKKGKKKGETQGDENQGDNKKSKTEKDVDSISTDKEPVVEDVITIETQELLEEGTGSSPNRELQSPKGKAQTIAEGGTLMEEQQLAEGRVEVKSEEPPIETPEVSLTDQAKSEEVVKKDKQKPSQKSEGQISVLCHECDIGIVDPVDQQCITNCITSADNPKEKLESTTNSGTQKDESGYTTNPDNFVDCLNSSADPKCPLDLKESTAGNSNNIKEEDAIKVSVDEAQTIQDTKEEGINFHSRIVQRPALEKSMVPEDLIANDGVITHPEHVTENAIKYLTVAGQDEQNGSPDECKNALVHKDISIALPANVDKCKNVSGENCGTSLDSNCPAAETIRQPEQLMDLPGCPVADKHLDENNEPVTLDEEKASNVGISTETKLNDTETRLQDPVKETPETIDFFREQCYKESKLCTMVAEAEEQDDPIEAKLEDNKVPGPSEQGNDEGDDDIDEGQSFDFNDLDSVVSANVFPVTSQEVSQEVRMMEGNKMEVEPGKEKAIKEEEDWDKSTGKPQGTVEGVSTIVAKQPLEQGSDSAPE